MTRAPSYWDYLGLGPLLELQRGLEDDEAKLAPDELHFIVVHQAFELWFKLVLRELRLARDHLAARRVAEESIPHVVHHLRRINEILRLLVDQFRVMETLTPQDFLDFRDKLVPASGFQSFQMREIEILLGLEDAQRFRFGEADALGELRRAAAGSTAGPMVLARIEQAQRELPLRQALHEWLYRTPIQGSSPDDAGDDDVVERFLSAYLEAVGLYHTEQAEGMVGSGIASAAGVAARFGEARVAAEAFLAAADVGEEFRRHARRIRAAVLFIESYRELPLLAWPRLLIDTVVELEEQMVLFRHRHARMVERTIGRRIGTGGSAGVDYLDQTTSYRVFTELWMARTLLLPRRHRPPIENDGFYRFARE